MSALAHGLSTLALHTHSSAIASLRSLAAYTTQGLTTIHTQTPPSCCLPTRLQPRRAAGAAGEHFQGAAHGIGAAAHDRGAQDRRWPGDRLPQAEAGGPGGAAQGAAAGAQAKVGADVWGKDRVHGCERAGVSRDLEFLRHEGPIQPPLFARQRFLNQVHGVLLTHSDHIIWFTLHNPYDSYAPWLDQTRTACYIPPYSSGPSMRWLS